MAMKKSTPPPRPGGTGSPRKSSMELGTRKGTKVRKITKVTKPMTKSVVRNPDAPKPVGAGAPRGAVRVITPSETFMKKSKARRDRSGVGRPQNASSFSKGRTVPPGPNSASTKYKSDRGASSEQYLKGVGTYPPTFASRKEEKKKMSSTQSKGAKSNQGVKPKKATPPAPKPKPKRFGRGGGLRGGGLFGGSGLGRIK